MVDNLARKPNSPGAGLPEFIADRMQELGYRPSFRKLAAGTGIDPSQLRRNLIGSQSMNINTAWKIAEFLQISIDDLVNEVPQILSIN